jgi:uncharacterized membrane protein YfcA
MFDETLLYLYISGGAVLAGSVRGFSGFGAATVYMPIASSVVTPAIAAPALLFCDFLASMALLRDAIQKARAEDLKPLFLGAFFGFPLGLELLVRTDPIVVRWIASAVILTSLATIASGWRYRGPSSRWLEVCIGLISGALAGIAQIGNPPIVVYWLGRDMPPERVRANLIVYFSILTVVGILFFLLKGLVTGFILAIAAITLPGYALGMWLGKRLFELAPQVAFRRVSIAVVCCAILVSLPITDTWFNRR